MKILIIVPNISQSGGTERAATNLANMLESTGYTVVLLSLSSAQSNKPYYKLNDPIKIIHLDLPPTPVGIKEKFRWYPQAIAACRRVVPGIMADLIFGEGHNVSSMLPFIKVNNPAPIISCEHIVFSSIPLSSRLIMKLVYAHLDGLVVLSQHARMGMKKLNKNIVVIPNTLPFVTEGVSELNFRRILMVGRLSVEKGYDRLVAVAQILKNRYPLWHIDIFGEGDLKDQLLSLYEKENVSDYITINSPKKNIEEEYLKSSIYLMTSYTEAMPMVLLEAKSCGVPVVGYKCEGTAELIRNEEDGFLIDDGNAADMAEKLCLLIENKELRQIMGANARKNALPYSPQNIISVWDAFLTRMINKD